MTEGTHWNVIINESTCFARSWKKWLDLFEKNHIWYAAWQTNSLEQLSDVLAECLNKGGRNFLFCGGDGTLHHGGNLLIQQAGEECQTITIGVLPCGTGNDWVRTFGITRSRVIAALRMNKTEPLHLIKVTWPDGRSKYAFNMVGGALDAAVVNELLKSKVNIPGSLKYPIGLLKTLMKPHQWHGAIKIDGVDFNGQWLTIQAGFGKYCGGGMYVLPHTQSDHAGLLLMRPKSMLQLLLSLPKLYNGKVGQQEEAIALYFSTMEILNDGVPFEADGEWLGESPLTLTTSLGVFQRLAVSK
ncbi:MAG: diacylglycerol kinase family protein [Saprospiraceae bacterium]